MLSGALSPHQVENRIAPIEEFALAGDFFPFHQLLALDLGNAGESCQHALAVFIAQAALDPIGVI